MHRFSFQLLILFLFTTSTLFAEPLRLGLSAPLSGGGAAWGNDAKNVLEFANEKLANNTYKLIFEDDRCDPKTALTVARKLSSVDKVDVAFLVCGQATMAATKAYRQSEVSVVATLATPSSISGSGAWRTSLNDARASQKLSQVIANKTDAISVLTEENDYSVSFFKDFAEAAKKDELRVENEYYLSSQTDFRAQLLKLKNKGAKAVFLNTQTEEALANILKQMKLLNFS
ncbi:MAG: ABC transporter substrate-binding protein, partial [Bdellovibrionales bacterium]|nr:ABC transporter substrate-binding protein [Bdellovibrionales bacterium]